MKCLARFSAIADFPVPQTPWMNINLLPFWISSRISFTMSAWVLLLEKFRGGKELVVGCTLVDLFLLLTGASFRLLVVESGDWKLEFSEFALSSFSCSDHMGEKSFGSLIRFCGLGKISK